MQQLRDAFERKAPRDSDGRERLVLRPLGARSVRFSKNVNACQRLGFVADI